MTERSLLAQDAPRTSTREGRVLLLSSAAEALLEGAMPTREAATFLGAALLAYLEQGGHLTREYLKIDAPQGSHHTADVIWRSARGLTRCEGKRR